MEPLPESVEAVESFGPFMDADDILRQLDLSAALVRLMVRSLVGVSLGAIEHGVTFTMVASSAEIAALDGVQYADDGPCVAAVREERVVAFNNDDPTNEATWLTFARASAAQGVASTLTLPILTDTGEVRGSVNLYASTPNAFDGYHEKIAKVFGAWAPGAVTNADLDFETRRTAQRAPQVLRGQLIISQAIGILVSARGVDVEAARAMVQEAAVRAGVEEVEIARRIVAAFNRGAL